MKVITSRLSTSSPTIKEKSEEGWVKWHYLVNSRVWGRVHRPEEVDDSTRFRLFTGFSSLQCCSDTDCITNVSPIIYSLGYEFFGRVYAKPALFFHATIRTAQESMNF